MAGEGSGSRPWTSEVDGTWERREPALAAVAVIGVGAVAARLASAARERLRDGAELLAIADPEYLVVLGAEHELPWTDGARYLGWDGSALTLTTHRVWPAADLWRDAAVAEAGGNGDALVVVLPEQIIVAAMPVRAADPEALAAMFAPHRSDVYEGRYGGGYGDTVTASLTLS